MRPFHFSTIAWGDSYVELLLDVSLPTQLAPGNLPAVPRVAGNVFRIYTTADYVERIRHSPVVRQLQAIVPIEISALSPESCARFGPHELLSHCHRDTLLRAQQAGAYSVFVSPDGVYADGAHRRLVELAAAGNQVVMVASVRLLKESFVPMFLRAARPADECSARVTPRQLVAWTLQHLHSNSQDLFWPPQTKWPSHLYWNVGDEGLLARCFHVHPMLLAPLPSDVRLEGTIDGPFVEQQFRDRARIHLVTDSDEICVAELSRVQQLLRPLRKPLAIEQVAVWTAKNASPLHLWMFAQPIRFHAVDCSPLWEQVEAQARQALEHAVMSDLVQPLRRLAIDESGNDPRVARRLFEQSLQQMLAGRIDELVERLDARREFPSVDPEQRRFLDATVDFYRRGRPHLNFQKFVDPSDLERRPTSAKHSPVASAPLS